MQEPSALTIIGADGRTRTFAVRGAGGIEAAALAALQDLGAADVLVAEYEAGHSVRLIPRPEEDAAPARRLRLVVK